MNEVTFEIVTPVCVIDETDSRSLELNIVSWNKAMPKYDLRYLTKQADGTKRPQKGLTLSLEALEKLKETLTALDLSVNFGED